MPKKSDKEPKSKASKQDVINKLDEVHFALNEHKTNSTDEPIDYSDHVNKLQDVLDGVKKLSEKPEKAKE